MDLSFKSKGFDSVFTQLYSLALKSKVTDDKRVIAMFYFLGNKIELTNKNEYSVAVLFEIETHLKMNGISDSK